MSTASDSLAHRWIGLALAALLFLQGASGGHVGEVIVGLEGIALLFLVIAGVYVWWPGAGRLKSGFRVRVDGGTDRVMRMLHRASGGAVAIVLAFSAVTGALMIFKLQATPVVSPIGYTPKPSADISPMPDRTRVSIDGLVHASRKKYGDSALREVRFRGDVGQVIVIYPNEEQSTRDNATRQIFYNAYTGDEIGAYVPSALPAGNGFFDGLSTTPRMGGGIVGQLIIVTGGIGLVFFTLSGVWLWSSRHMRRVQGRRRHLRHAVSET